MRLRTRRSPAIGFAFLVFTGVMSGYIVYAGDGKRLPEQTPELISEILSGRWVKVKHVYELPQEIVGPETAGGTPRMADPGKPYNGGCARYPNLPNRSLIFAGRSEKYLVVAYTSGGISVRYGLSGYRKSSGQWEEISNSALPPHVRTLEILEQWVKEAGKIAPAHEKVLSSFTSIRIDPKDSSKLLGQTKDGATENIWTIRQWAEKANAKKLFGEDWRDALSNLRFKETSVSPDGKYLAFGIVGHFQGYGGLLNLSNNEVKTLGLNGKTYWSPDSKQIVTEMVGEGTGLVDVKLYDIPSGRWSTLFSPNLQGKDLPVSVSSITWQASGQEIRFVLCDKNGENGRWRVNSDGSGLKKI
jgi:hypothetical protein